jgi:hypothetical protein
MKLIFKKDENHQINVFHEVDGNQQGFSYVEMIKELIKSRKLEEPDISDGFTDAEINSIKSMVSFINKEISETSEPDETTSS